MGYYTRYELKIVHKDNNKNINNPSNFIRILKNECEDADYALDEDGYTREETKWYTYNDDLKKFSKKYNNLIFILTGIGEEGDDIWREYFNNGKSHYTKAKLAFDDYDEGKLV